MGLVDAFGHPGDETSGDLLRWGRAPVLGDSGPHRVPLVVRGGSGGTAELMIETQARCRRGHVGELTRTGSYNRIPTYVYLADDAGQFQVAGRPRRHDRTGNCRRAVPAPFTGDIDGRSA